MSLYYVTTNTTAQALDLNQALEILSQPSGGQEIGHYILAMPAYTGTGVISNYVPSISRHATPVSVSINTADVNNGVMANSPPLTDHLTSSGFHVYSTPSSGSQANPVDGGLYLIQY